MTQTRQPDQPLDLEIIILNYKTSFWLKKTLVTLKEWYLNSTKHQVRVTVVDNHSQDDSVEMVKTEFPWVHLIESPVNNGFAAGNNIALAQTTARYAMLMNSDMESNQDTNLDRLVEYLDQKPTVGVITPLVMLPTQEIDPACHRGEPTLWASFCYFAGLEKLFPHSPLFAQYHQWFKPRNTIHEVDACSGAAMIIRTEALKKVGLLDEQFFMYAEDLDWCKRFREAGYKVVFNPQVRITHHKYKSGLSSASKKLSKKTTRHFYDTMLQYYEKHYAHKYPVFVKKVVALVLTIKKGFS